MRRRDRIEALLASALLLAVGATASGGGDKAPPAAPPASPTAPAVPTLPRPDAGDVVVLDDGTVLLGTVTGTDDEVVVAPPSGGEQRFARSRVALALSGGKRLHRGEEVGVVAAWNAWLRAAHVDPLPTKKLADATPAARALWWKDVLAAAAWCGERKLKYAGAALLAEGLDEKTWDEAGAALALELEPLEFPFTPEDSEKAALWVTWARRLLPLAGRFVLKGDAPGSAAEVPLWRDEAVAVRTRNLIVWSLDRDVAVLGSILTQGETTVRALEGFFGMPEQGNDEPLEIRLFRDRQQYLTESDGGRGFAPVWSGGFFSPGESVSRFYVQRDEKSGAFLEGMLHEVLSHEMTHHWLETRLLRGVELEGVRAEDEAAVREGKFAWRPEQPGHWIVEGIARFVEDQAVLWAKTGVRFDRSDAECIGDAADAVKDGMAIPITRYVDISPQQFQFLSDVPKRGRSGSINTERGVFYDQGGALAFFMANRRGAEGKKLLSKYLRDVYAGKMDKQSWKRLGFTSAEELEKEFRAFLKDPSKK